MAKDFQLFRIRVTQFCAEHFVKIIKNGLAGNKVIVGSKIRTNIRVLAQQKSQSQGRAEDKQGLAELL